MSVLLTLALAGSVPAASAPESSAPPRIVPLPSPPPGPRIRRVTHDAVRPLRPGARVRITVLTEPGMKVTVSIGTAVRDIPCSPSGQKPDTYTCEALVPEAAAGANRARARVSDPKGVASELSAALPVVVEPADPWREVNTLNMRLRPAYFAAGSDALDEDARAALAKNAETLKASPSYPIVIEGRCDTGERGDLKDLSRRRAEAALKHLASLGIPKETMKAVALGDSQPIVNPKDETMDRAANRTALVLFEAPAPPPRP